MEFGYMVTRPSRLLAESQLVSLEPVSFLEIPVHDSISKLSWKQFQEYFRLSENFRGYLVMHGEGETDGRSRIRFSSPVAREREIYVKKLADLIGTIHVLLQDNLRVVIVHPGRYYPKYSRDLQIKWLSESLIKLSELVPQTQLCIESRGCDRQGKVLRSIPSDIIELDDFLKQSGTNVSHCYDLAQTFVCFGMKGVTEGIKSLMENHVHVSEIHASDVIETKSGHRISVEIGKGAIRWSQLLEEVEDFHCRILLEVIGGVGPFKRSMEFLRRIRLSGQSNAVLLPNS